MAAKMGVVIIADQPLFRYGVAEALGSAPDIEILAEGASPEDALQLASDLAPDILVLDLGVRGAGLAAARAVAVRCPATRILMLTASGEHEQLLAAPELGVRAYVLKEVSVRELVDVVRRIQAGQVYVTPGLAAALLMEMATAAVAGEGQLVDPSPDGLIDDLTDRERQILELVAGGLSNREIAQRIRLTEKAVKHQMTNILHRLHVRNRIAAALLLESRNHRLQKGGTDRG